MKDKQPEMEDNIYQLLESFNADETEIAAFLENPKQYLESMGAENLNSLSDDTLRQMIQNRTDF